MECRPEEVLGSTTVVLGVRRAVHPEDYGSGSSYDDSNSIIEKVPRIVARDMFTQ